VVGVPVLPLLVEELHRLELAQVVRDAGLRDAHQRDQLGDVQGRPGDQPQDAQPGGVAERPIRLGKGLHINVSAYLDLRGRASGRMEVSTPVPTLSAPLASEASASRFARATSSTYTKSRVCPPSPLITGSPPRSILCRKIATTPASPIGSWPGPYTFA